MRSSPDIALMRVASVAALMVGLVGCVPPPQYVTCDARSGVCVPPPGPDTVVTCSPDDNPPGIWIEPPDPRPLKCKVEPERYF